jgi:hypothetical protein
MTEPGPGHHGSVLLTATAAVPHPDLDRALLELRAQLRAEARTAGVADLVDWRQLVVTGPEERADARGWAWSWYRASLEVAVPAVEPLAVVPAAVPSPALPVDEPVPAAA